MYIMYSDDSPPLPVIFLPLLSAPFPFPICPLPRFILVGLFYDPFNVAKTIRVNLGWNYPLEPGGGTSGFTTGSNNVLHLPALDSLANSSAVKGWFPLQTLLYPYLIMDRLFLVKTQWRHYMRILSCCFKIFNLCVKG